MAIFHNPATAGLDALPAKVRTLTLTLTLALTLTLTLTLDALPAKEASEASQGGKAAAGDGKPPPLAGKPKADLAKVCSLVITPMFPSYHP